MPTLHYAVDSVLTFPAGQIRIDRITDEQVYFARWRGDEVTGELVRMPRAVFEEAVANEARRDARSRT